MNAKLIEHKSAVFLRRQGDSYSEIADKVRVSKSTLSVWLKNIELSDEFKEGINLKKHRGQQRGAAVRKSFRERRQNEILLKASKEIGKITKRELWLLGVMAYWCEGTKQKEYNVSARVVFSNSDASLVRLFIKWLRIICNVKDSELIYNLYIHEISDSSLAIEYWSKNLGISKNLFGKTIIKKHEIRTNRLNTGNSYNGLMRISVRKSTDFNREISGWISGINSALV